MKTEQENTLKNIDQHGFPTVQIDHIKIAPFDRKLSLWATYVAAAMARQKNSFGDYRLELCAEYIERGEGFGIWGILDWANMACRIAYPIAVEGQHGRGLNYMAAAESWAAVLLDLLENSLDVEPGKGGELHQVRNLMDISLAEFEREARACMAGEVVE
tara:strand:- start:2626 stop:3102 length:477 start_codon:yes stop_codon:yes gene_type:complete